MKGRQEKNITPGRRLVAAVVLAAAGAALGGAARGIPGFGQWYSTHIYPVLVGGIGRVTGLVPFSVAEVLLYAGVLFSPGFPAGGRSSAG